MELQRGQVAVVTGAASGLGLGLCEVLASRGLDVVLADVEADALADAVATIEAAGVGAIGVPTDVRFSEQLEALAVATLDRFGRVDVVVNNAGVMCTPKPTWQIEDNDWEWVLAVNLRGVVNGIRAFVPRLIAQNSGHVVNISAMAGVSAAPWLGPYTAAKHAVVALSEALSVELALVGADVGVCVACPGIMATKIFAAERNRPAELAVDATQMTDAELHALQQWVHTVSGDSVSGKEAAEVVVRGIESNTLHVLPNGSSAGVRSWTERLLADLPEN